VTESPSAGERKPTENEACDIAIVGAGAAGLAAAIFAAEEAAQWATADGPKPRVVLLDGATQIGAKILVSGGGRCNVTNEEVRARDFNGNQPFIRNVLSALGVQETVAWFESMGVHLVREETGKMFPERGGSKGVLGALTKRCEEGGAVILTDHRVREVSIRPSGETPAPEAGADTQDGGEKAKRGEAQGPAAGFILRHDLGTLRARCVILATGGRSIPLSGSDGEGWEIARRLGHGVTTTHPALVPLVLDAGMFHGALSGVSHPAELSTYLRGKRIDRRTGSLLWTHFGISGPVVLDASRHWIAARAADPGAELRCNFLPGWDTERLDHWLVRRIASTSWRPSVRVLADLLPERVARAHLDARGIAPAMPIGEVKREVRRQLVSELVSFTLPVTGDRGWNFAEVTAGGVPLNEVDYRTMASRKAPGLFLVGEMLDCDGRIGGFNFQWAWSTGRLAGRAAAARLRDPATPAEGAPARRRKPADTAS
jgi:predicted flavoprotein YhiN